MIIPWKYIFYYTWLILPKWVMCKWYPDLFLRTFKIFDISVTSTDSELSDLCNAGVRRYFDAAYYGGGEDYGVHAYFRSFKQGT